MWLSRQPELRYHLTLRSTDLINISRQSPVTVTHTVCQTSGDKTDSPLMAVTRHMSHVNCHSSHVLNISLLTCHTNTDIFVPKFLGRLLFNISTAVHNVTISRHTLSRHKVTSHSVMSHTVTSLSVISYNVMSHISISYDSCATCRVLPSWVTVTCLAYSTT